MWSSPHPLLALPWKILRSYIISENILKQESRFSISGVTQNTAHVQNICTLSEYSVQLWSEQQVSQLCVSSDTPAQRHVEFRRLSAGIFMCHLQLFLAQLRHVMQHLHFLQSSTASCRLLTLIFLYRWLSLLSSCCSCCMRLTQTRPTTA